MLIVDKVAKYAGSTFQMKGKGTAGKRLADVLGNNMDSDDDKGESPGLFEPGTGTGTVRAMPDRRQST